MIICNIILYKNLKKKKYKYIYQKQNTSKSILKNIYAYKLKNQN